MPIIKTVLNINPGVAGVLSDNVDKMNRSFGQKSKDFVAGKIEPKNRNVLLKTIREQRKIESQKVENENQRSFDKKALDVMSQINNLTREFINKSELARDDLDERIKKDSVQQYTEGLQALLNTKHGDRNIFGGDGVVVDLSKAEWDSASKKLKNMDWINAPHVNHSSNYINMGIINIVESLAQFKAIFSTDNFKDNIKPKMEISMKQLASSISEVKGNIENGDARVKSNNNEIGALQEEIDRIAKPDSSGFMQDLQQDIARFNVCRGIAGVYNGMQNTLIKGY